MGWTDSTARLRRRVAVGVLVALGLASAFVVPVVASAGGPDVADLRRVAAVERPADAVAAVAAAPAVIPPTDAAVAAAAWNAEHPPPPPPLPVPAPLPNASAYRELVEIGRIQIPKIGVDQAVREGIEQMVIDAGPAHWPGTAEFGGWGNVVLAGHRSTKTEPFRRNAELVPGDEIVVSDATGTYHYAVTGVEVVDATALWIVDQHEGRSLTIFTCHPIGSSAQRLVVHAELHTRARPGA